METSSRPSFDRILAEIDRLLLLPEFRAGEPLPKVAALAREWRVSNKTVGAALKELSRRGLARLEGKTWKAASGLAPVSDLGAGASQPVVAVFLPDLAHWRRLAAQERSGAFIRGFSESCESYRVIIVPIFPDSLSDMPGIVAGRQAISRWVSSLGPRFRGFLFLGAVREVPDWSGWMRFLASFGRPSAWFDRYEEDLSPELGGSPGPAWLRAFGAEARRFHVSEASAVRAAADALRPLGHRRIGFPLAYPGHRVWMEPRALALQSSLRGKEESPERESPRGGETERLELLIRRDYPEGFWKRRDGESRDAILKRLARHGLPSVRQFLASPSNRTLAQNKSASIIRNTPYLLPYFAAQPITCLIAGNDEIAADYSLWLRVFGIRVPQNLSLLSFDNHAEALAWSVSSIDFGLAPLGRLAFRFLMGIPSEGLGRDYSVAAEARLVDRGSLAAPGKPRRIHEKGTIW